MAEFTTQKVTCREPGTLVYLISARGPYPEKSSSILYLSREEAEGAAETASLALHPARFSVYEMMIFPTVSDG